MTKVFQLPTCPSNPDTLPIGPQYPWLAPLAGYSDLPFRLLCREYGAAVCVTEMVSAKGLVYESPGTNELLMTLPEDQPLVVQLFGAEAYFLGRAVELLRQAGYGWFDLNMGCSVSKVLRQGAGAAMLGECALVPYESPIRESGILFYNTLFDENYGGEHGNCADHCPSRFPEWTQTTGRRARGRLCGVDHSDARVSVAVPTSHGRCLFRARRARAIDFHFWRSARAG